MTESLSPSSGITGPSSFALPGEDVLPDVSEDV